MKAVCQTVDVSKIVGSFSNGFLNIS